MKLIYVSYIPYTHSLMVIIYNILNNLCTMSRKFVYNEPSWSKDITLSHPFRQSQKVLDFGCSMCTNISPLHTQPKKACHSEKEPSFQMKRNRPQIQLWNPISQISGLYFQSCWGWLLKLNTAEVLASFFSLYMSRVLETGQDAHF